MFSIIKKILKIIIFVILTIIFIISSFLISKAILEHKKNNEEVEQLIEEVVVQDVKETEKKEEKSIDWEKLKSINEDIIGWIQIENTNINYPILKDEDLFYLKHTYKKSYSNYGSIFTINAKPLEDKETVIYGHNMRDGSMFSTLDQYLDYKFLQKHKKFMIYTPTQNYVCTVFSVYSIGIDEETKNIKNLDFDATIEYYKKTSKYAMEGIGKVNKIVKLSTCSYLNNHVTPTNQRYYVIAKVETINN